jgi:Domain of unknown function (DUF222)/HNH endonuclease
MVVGEATVGLLRSAVDALLTADLTGLSGVELAGFLDEVEVERRRLDSLDARLVAEVGERRLAGEYGRASVGDLLVELLRICPAEAKARVRRAEDVGPRRGLTGESLGPLLPLAAQAQRAGGISAAHVAVVAGCLDAFPAGIGPEVAAQVEQSLVEFAHRLHPRQLRSVANRVLAHLDPDGVEPRDREVERRRGLELVQRGDGSYLLSGRLTGGCGAVWQTIVDAVSAPTPSVEGERDDRTPSQRRHDGLLDAGLRLLRSATLPDSGGAPVTVLVRLDADQLRRRSGYATTETGADLSVRALLALAGEAELVPLLTDTSGEVLSYGRARRLASPAQRRALAARDGGCCFPGCSRPASWSQAHHVVPWLDGGHTDLNNLCLLCGFHHREFARRGWEVRMTGGVPEWIPPPWVDPAQKPLRNTTQHLPDIDLSG